MGNMLASDKPAAGGVMARGNLRENGKTPHEPGAGHLSARKFHIREKCRVNTNRDADSFVGIRCENGDVSVNFPLGFRVSEDERGLRKDILLLIRTIGATTARKDSAILKTNRTYDQTAFPVQAYMHVIADYYARGYYKEQETRHVVAGRGKIDWNRTIKTRKPYVDWNAGTKGTGGTGKADAGEAGAPCIKGASVFYLDFVTRKSAVNENELVTQIHKYCVYESFEKMGWLYTDAMPARPQVKYNGKLFKRAVREKLRDTFQDRNRALFRSMLAILEYEGNQEGNKDYRYGTWRFEYVWEALVDRAYGIADKREYFPRTKWKIGGKEFENACLEPDTIMVCQGDVYVLDAKYYKYGATSRPGDLPSTASIHKQITYGEYIANQERFREIHGENFQVYNAFLMPFAAADETCPVVKIGEACADWKSGRHTYETVHGVLVDVKYLMKIGTRADEGEIGRLAGIIKGGQKAERRQDK